jgi:hypothetical protein
MQHMHSPGVLTASPGLKGSTLPFLEVVGVVLTFPWQLLLGQQKGPYSPSSQKTTMEPPSCMVPEVVTLLLPF